MVALKPRPQPGLLRCVRGKQERRGGIETPRAAPEARAAGGKQERRGGIENSAGPGWPGPGRRRSRNAVVALKTPLRRLEQAAQVTEAGTPWWH